MTARHDILRAIERAHEISLDELLDATDLDRKQLQQVTRDAIKVGLIDCFRDDVTSGPAYRLTDKGHAWLINRPAEHYAHPEVAKNAGIDASDCSVDTAPPSAEGVDVAPKPQAKPPKPSGKGVEAAKPAGDERDAPMGYIVYVPVGDEIIADRDAAMRKAEAFARESGGACVCAVIAEARSEIVWKRA